MNRPKFLFGSFVFSAIVGAVFFFLLFATFAFAIPGPGGWASWRVGLFASPFGAAVGVVAYLAALDWRKRN